MERVQRINQLIKRELNQIIFRKVDFPEDVLTTITRVDTSGNLIQAKVYISVMPADKISRVLETLNYQIYNIQQRLNKRLKMRPTPRIIFVQEEKTREAGRIEELLEKIQQKDIQ